MSIFPVIIFPVIHTLFLDAAWQPSMASGKFIEEETKITQFCYLLTLVKRFVCLRMWKLMARLCWKLTISDFCLCSKQGHFRILLICHGLENETPYLSLR